MNTHQAKGTLAIMELISMGILYLIGGPIVMIIGLLFGLPETIKLNQKIDAIEKENK